MVRSMLAVVRADLSRDDGRDSGAMQSCIVLWRSASLVIVVIDRFVA